MATLVSAPVCPPDRTPEDAPTPFTGGTHSGDFISGYADYADILEAPREVHEVVAISLLAAVLNRNVSIQFGGLALRLDLWTLILSGSGLGRNTLVNLMYPILDASGQQGLIRGTTWGSGPGFYQDLAQNPTGLYVWPEMSQILKTLSQSQFTGTKEWLTDRFDNPRVPDAIRYRATGQPTNTPPITFAQPPRLNILATSSLDWFVSSLGREDTTGGFVPRWFMVRVPDTRRVIPKPQEPNPELVKPLADHLAAASKLTGVADLSQVEELYGAWYREARHRFESQPNPALAMPFFNRLRALVLKLAVISEVSASCTLRVSPAAMKRALAWATATEDTIFKLILTGMTPEGFALDKIEQAVQKAGAVGITQSDLTRAFQGDRYRDRKERLATLVSAGKVCVYQRRTGGRTAYLYVWSDFREQHEKDFSGDTLHVAS